MVMAKPMKTFALSSDPLVMSLLLLISYSIISIPEVNKILDLSDSLDVKALRAVRVLRPLKLISGVPSKFWSTSNELLILRSGLLSFTRKNKLGWVAHVTLTRRWKKEILQINMIGLKIPAGYLQAGK